MKDIFFVWLPVIAATGVIFIGFILIFMGNTLSDNSKLLEKKGVSGKATVTQHYRSKVFSNHADKHKIHTEYENLIDYEIEKNGEKFLTKGILPSTELWENLSVGDQIEVIYLINDPKINRLAESHVNTGQFSANTQLIGGALLIISGVIFIVSGLMSASAIPPEIQAGENWVDDKGVVLSISKSDDPFVRLMQPKTRVVKISIGDDDGGREYTGLLELSLAPDKLPQLKLNDNLNVLRAPDDKNKAVLQGLQNQ
ncbi:MAG: DUF3592 domain-containing protein [Gammaproteobacteria bacterium]|nr:DUF3592 domain-containing protein [Gammaproteobacteria bacterium]